MLVELDDSYISFVKEKMQELDANTFTDKDFEVFNAYNHTIIGYIHNDEVITFCCTMGLGNNKFVVYTWCNGTRRSKKAFLEGIDYLLENYPDIQFMEEVKSHPLFKAYTKHKESK